MEYNPRPPNDASTTVSALSEQKAKNFQIKFWLFLGVLVATLLLVLLVLPYLVGEPVKKGSIGNVIPEPKLITEDLVKPPVDKHLRTNAEQALKDFLRLQAQPDLVNAEGWVADDWKIAMDTADHGDMEFSRGNFVTALQSYQQAGMQLQDILDNREQILQQYLAAGWQQLQYNEIEESILSFERVLAMQYDHQDAQLGLEQATVRNHILELMLKAQQAETTNNLELAVTSYTSALQLDPTYFPAQHALKKIESELQNRTFQQAIGQALQAIDTGEFTKAQQSLLKAASIKPQDPAIKDVRQRLLLAQRLADLNSLREQAEQLENNEDWDGAVKSYNRALAIDPQATFSVNGLAHAKKRQQLHQKLDHYLSDTTRLFSSEPLHNAVILLAKNQQPITNEPLLARKLTKLQQAVDLAKKPLDLFITSDNLTEITIYKVGRFGSFEQKQLSLPPGKYTISGIRQGYRDILKMIELKPGMNKQTVEIYAEEKI